jgi:hypothetical protein
VSTFSSFFTFSLQPTYNLDLNLTIVFREMVNFPENLQQDIPFCVVACENIPQKKYCSDVGILYTWKGPHKMSWAQEYNMPIKMQNTSCNYSTLPPSSMYNWGVSAEVPFWCVAAISD